MFKKYGLLVLFFLTLLMNSCFAQKREIAITIDDLPFVGEAANFHLNMIIDALKSTDTPATGFVIASKIRADNWPTLHKFHDAGLGLGNHTLTHANLNKIAAENYIQEVEAADKILSPVLTEPKFFRYPYLATSNGRKKTIVANYLAAKNYQVAPITIDSRDFTFNQLLLSVPEAERRNFLAALKPCYLDYIHKQTLKAEEHSRLAKNTNQSQILLIHANLLNAYVLPDIINLYKQNGYVFVSLEDALHASVSKKKTTLPGSLRNKRERFDIESFMAWD